VKTVRNPVPKNLLKVSGSVKVRNPNMGTFIKVYRSVTIPRARNGFFLLKFFIRYALESSVPRRVDKAKMKLSVKPLGAKETGLSPKPVKRPASMRTNIWTTAMSPAMKNICLLNHDRIFLRPQTHNVARARIAQQVEGKR